MKRIYLSCSLVLGVVIVLIAVLMCPQEMNYYISPDGSDSNDGSYDTPVKSIQKAQQLAKNQYGKQIVNFVLMNGVHYLDSCIQIRSDQSGTRRCPVTFKALNKAKAVINGGCRLAVDWKQWNENIYFAQLSDTIKAIDQLFIDGQRKYMARYPNRNGKNVFDAWDLSDSVQYSSESDIFNPEHIERWRNPRGAYIHAMHGSLWGDMHWVVTEKKDNHLVYEGGWQNNRPSMIHPVYRFIENIFEELDNPGEWFFDKDSNRLYYYPEDGENLQDALIEYVCLPELVHLEGNREEVVHHIRFDGLVFCNSARTFMENKEPLLRSDWTICRKGAITFSGCEDCEIRNCEFNQVGGNAIVINNYNRRLLLSGCYIHDSGANGIAFIGNSSSVRSPLFRYGPQNYSAIDRTPGPQNDEYPADCTVEECLITRTGRVEKQTAPIQISISYAITINHCSIYEVPRAGININEGTFGGHIIENCDIFDTVLETGDHGSFNSWGRDRYWTPDISATVKEVAKDTSIHRLDMLAPNIIRHNRWKCNHGWDMDLDDGSSHYRIYNNVLLSGGMKLREGYDRIVFNNILINNTLHPHVWYENSGDVFIHNIVFAPYHAVGMNVGMHKNGKWGKEIDKNFFVYNGVESKRNLENGCDFHSISGNPMFVDMEKGNYAVADNSPAFDIGFKNFDTRNFGVTIPYLKKMTRIPQFPKVLINQGEDGATAAFWHKARIKNIVCREEQSATGLKDWNGILVLSVESNSELGQSGLKANDVILEINGMVVKNVQELLQAESENNSGRFEFKVWRNQAEQIIRGLQ